jgi:hypothetical protein
MDLPLGEFHIHGVLLSVAAWLLSLNMMVSKLLQASVGSFFIVCVQLFVSARFSCVYT